MNRGIITIRNTNSDNIKVYIELSEDGTVWMTKNEIASLFSVYHSSVQLNIRALFKSDKLVEKVGKKEEYSFLNNKRKCVTEYFNLEVIITLSYRLDSYICILFRQWIAQQVSTSLKSSSLPIDWLETKTSLN